MDLVMAVRFFVKLLVVFVLSFNVNVLFAEELEKWNLHSNNSGHSDYLAYKLKYSGFITLFIWKDLADVAFISNSQSGDFEGHTSCRLEMRLTTENYSFSESLHPYRYRWRSTVSPDLRKIFLVEEISEGKKEEYNINWVNWESDTIDYFRKRQLIVPETDVFAEEEYDNYFDAKVELPKPHWEKDGEKSMPSYFNHLPNIEDSHDYLVYDKSVEFEQITEAIDPLAMLYSARWYNKNELNKPVFNVVHKDEIREYQLEILGEEMINIGDQEISTTKINIKRRNEKEAEEEGFISLWVSNDARRIPIRYEVQVRIGTMHVELTEKSLHEYNQPKTCFTVAHSSNMWRTPQFLIKESP